MRLYVNGVLVDDKGHSEGAPWAEGDLVIGCNPNYSPERFDGLIDEVRVYNRARWGRGSAASNELKLSDCQNRDRERSWVQ